MTPSPPAPRHHAVEVIERALTDDGHPSPAHVARELVSRLEAAGLVIHDAPAATPRGRCDDHGMPYPCHGCAADAKAAS